jgi:hypothetical protein
MPLLSKPDAKILVVSAANKPVNEISAKLIERLSMEKQDERLLIRLHAIETETSVVFDSAVSDEPRKTPPRIIHDEALMEIGNLAATRFIYEHVKRSTAVKHGRDRRVTLLEHSLGTWMLRFGGIIESAWAEPEAWPAVRLNYQNFHDGDSNTRVEGAAMTLKQVSAVGLSRLAKPTKLTHHLQTISELRAHILSKAHVVVGTTTGVLEACIYTNFHPDIILIDECAR